MTTVVGLSTAPSMSYPFTRHSNSAGAPLPRIPKRSSSTSRSHSCGPADSPHTHEGPSAWEHHDSLTPKAPSVPAVLVVQPPTPPSTSPIPVPMHASHSEDSASSSSASQDSPLQFIVARQRRERSSRVRTSFMRPPEHSTPTPSVFHAKSSEERVAFPLKPSPVDDSFGQETPRASSSKAGSALRRSGSITIQSTPEPVTAVRIEPAIRAVSVCIPSDISSQLVRKKSGEPLKSSLKSRRSTPRGGLSVVTSTGNASKSEPSTPTHIKSVHFDSQLEHVKLFLAEQKPLAVSRDGSPTTDTSGTDSDFPSFIYGTDDVSSKPLVIEVVDMPKKTDKAADVALEELVLSADRLSMNGRVRVRNIAFEKWIAVRFTIDWWQTTSEVTARYVQSLEEGTFDVFAFTIRLNDILVRIEEKTMFIAIRYTVAGREIWDNNSGDNYQVKFSRSKPEPQRSLETSAESGMADLKSKLEKVAIGRETVGGYLAQKSPSPRSDKFDLRSNTPLSSRYDFSASLKSPWKRGSPESPTTRSRNSTYPTSFPPFPQRQSQSPSFRVRQPEDPAYMTRGSPRILDPEDDRQPAGLFYAGSDREDAPASTPPVFSRHRGRNHQRGYFDLGLSVNNSLRKTLPAAFREDAILRYNSVDTHRFSPSEEPKLAVPESKGLFQPWPLECGGSEESTPSITSTSESSRSSSPSGSPLDETVMFNFLGSGGARARSPVHDNNLDVFLNKFCFYTGSDSLLSLGQDVIQRSHSASSVEEFLYSPNPNYHLSPGQTPTRSPSFDDVVCMSGSSTPTARSMVESESSTPVSLAY